MEANATHVPGPTVGRPGSRNRLTADEATDRIDRYLSDSRAVVLHHRRVPGSRARISHLVVGPAGLTLVDSHHYKVPGVKIDARGPRRTAQARSDLVKPVLDQVEEVRELLAGTPYAGVPIDGALARSGDEGPRVLQDLNSPRVIVSGVRTIATEAGRDGDMDPGRVQALAQLLDDALE